MYAQDSIDLLQNSGIQFKKHEEDGIEPHEFAELLMTSGIVLMDNIKWLSFHSGYDFGYLLKLLTDQNLPAEEGDFFELLRMYFPNIYDVKYLMKSCKNLKGGLQEVADQLELRRVGPQHQAGSDSHLTGMAFFKMREVYDSVEFGLTLKNSEDKLFWRCADEIPNVASMDADNMANVDAKSNQGDSNVMEERTPTPTTNNKINSTGSNISGNSVTTENCANSTEDTSNSFHDTTGMVTETSSNASSIGSTVESSTGVSATEISADIIADSKTTDINQNIIPMENSAVN